MEATPDCYRADIARTKSYIAEATERIALYRHGLDVPEQEAIYYWRLMNHAEDAERSRAALVRQLAAVEQALQRAETLWSARAKTHAQEQ